MRGLAASLGLVQGRPFAPEVDRRRVLDAAAAVGDKIAGATSFGPRDDLLVWPDRRWTSNMVPGPHVVADPQFKTASYQDVDALLTFFYSAFETSNAMFLAMPGKGSQYAGACGFATLVRLIFAGWLPQDGAVRLELSACLKSSVGTSLAGRGGS